jgi:glutathione synthase/RimK-type ligase-like ATP-grasp enzyme
MPDISILYDQSETDELGIRLTAKEMGIELGYIPFYKSAFTFDNNDYSLKTIGKDYTSELKNTRVILNRCQGKNRRIMGTAILEARGKHVLNPLSVEENCQSKLKTLLGFSARGIKVPRTTYASPNPKEQLGPDRYQDNIETIRVLLENGVGSERIVIKPDAGSHGNGVSLSSNSDELREILGTVQQGITNPSGVVGQELIEKWFYDLRIIVKKKKGEPPVCYQNALARGGFKEFRTNTFLGNMVVRAKLPEQVRRTAVTCAEILAAGASSYVIALDAMPSIDENMMQDEEEIRQSFNDLETPFVKVSQVKKMKNKKENFEEYTNAINEAYGSYMDTDAYRHIENVVNTTLAETTENVVFHEGNACPDFWEQTRIIAGLNLAVDFLECAESQLNQ